MLRVLTPDGITGYKNTNTQFINDEENYRQQLYPCDANIHSAKDIICLHSCFLRSTTTTYSEAMNNSTHLHTTVKIHFNIIKNLHTGCPKSSVAVRLTDQTSVCICTFSKCATCAVHLVPHNIWCSCLTFNRWVRHPVKCTPISFKRENAVPWWERKQSSWATTKPGVMICT
jgi:hypothetical protein